MNVLDVTFEILSLARLICCGSAKEYTVPANLSGLSLFKVGTLSTLHFDEISTVYPHPVSFRV